MINNRHLKFRIAINKEFFNNIQIISKFNTKIQQKNNNITKNILSFIEFVYDFAIDKFENFDDNVLKNFKFQYFVHLKTYVI